VASRSESVEEEKEATIVHERGCAEALTRRQERMKGNKAGSTLVEKKKGSSTSSYASISSSPQATKRHAPSPNRNSPAGKEKYTVGSPPPKVRLAT
jgi:hypothetical protein